MATKTKIKEDIDLRVMLDAEYEKLSKSETCKYALLLATHVMESVPIGEKYSDVIHEGILINEDWQRGKARIHDVRQIGLKFIKRRKNTTICLFAPR